MSLIPAFEIGVWNAWILQVLFLLPFGFTVNAPSSLMSKERKERAKRATQDAPLNRTEKKLFFSTRAIIMPLTTLYSIFLPLKLGTVWLYVGLPIFVLALVITAMTAYYFAATPLGEPVTEGIYRISRHPLYVGGFLSYIGIGIVCASWVILLCGVLWFLLLTIVVLAEERLLIENYCDTYRDYINSTPRLIGVPK